jgi:hypothetical protein
MCTTSAIAGFPGSPSRVETAPSFTTHHDRLLDEPGVLEHTALHAAIHDGLAVVAERDGTRGHQRGHLRHHLARQSLRGRSHRQDAHGRLVPGSIQDVLGDGRVVVHRVGVRHTSNRGEASGGRRPASRRDVLLVLLTRLPEVRMQVDETGRHPQAVGVHLLGIRDGLDRILDGGEPAILDQHVADRVTPTGGIDDTPPPDPDPTRHAVSSFLCAAGGCFWPASK